MITIKHEIIGIDWSNGTDITMLSILNPKTREVKFVELEDKATTKEERTKIIEDLRKKYNVKEIIY